MVRPIVYLRVAELASFLAGKVLHPRTAPGIVAFPLSANELGLLAEWSTYGITRGSISIASEDRIDKNDAITGRSRSRSVASYKVRVPGRLSHCAFRYSVKSHPGRQDNARRDLTVVIRIRVYVNMAMKGGWK